MAAAVSEPTPENIALALGIYASGFYTLALFITRPIWLWGLGWAPVLNAVFLGIFNAAVIETIFLVVEKITGAEGIAAHPNLFIDLLITMPWYVVMVISFVRVQRRRRFPWATLLFLGAVYELGADGIVGQLAGLLFGSSRLLDPGYWVELAVFAFWVFIPVYSSMIWVPAWLVEKSAPAPRPHLPAWLDALKPMVWLIPFTGYVIVVIFILGMFNLAG